MSDLFEMMENGIPSSVDLKKNKQFIYKSPVLYSTSNNKEDIQFTFILDQNISNVQLEYLKKYIIKQEIFSFQILLPTIVDIDFSKNLADQYIEKKWKFEQYIKPWSKIICFGRSMFSICESRDLDCSITNTETSNDKKLDKNSIIEGFYDTLQTQSYFNDPQTKCVCWPVDGWIDLINNETGLFKDCFEVKWLKEQINRANNYILKPQKIIPIKYNIIENPNEWMLNEINTKKKDSILSWDLETGSTEEEGGLDPWDENGFIICFTISYYDNPYIGYYFDYSKIDLNILELYLLHFLHNGTNIGFDYKWNIVKSKISKKIINKQIYDSIHLSQIYNTNQRNSLKSNVWLYTWYGGYDRELDKYKEQHKEAKYNYAKIPKPILIPYSTQDPCMSNLVHQKMEVLVHDLDKKYPINFIPNSTWSMWKFYTELRIPTQKMFTEVELEGSEIQWNKVQQVSKYIRIKIDFIKEEIKKELNITDTNFNISSNDQLGLQIEKLGYKNYGISKKGLYLVNVDSLQKWKEEGYKWAELIEELHSLQTIYKTFVGDEKENNGYYQYRKYDLKVHPTFGVGQNSTGRNNCKNPNLQNILKHGNLAIEIKDFFTPINIEECCICELDGASLQLRIEASLSHDKTMKVLFQNNTDIHILTAHLLFGQGESFKEFESKTLSGNKKYKDYRQGAKAPNFSLCFNATPISFAKDSLLSGPYKWSLNQCKEYINLCHLENNLRNTTKYLLEKPLPGISNQEQFAYYLTCSKDITEKWLNQYKGIKEYIEYKILEGNTFGACFTPFGFIRRVPRLKFTKGKDDNKGRRKSDENVMSNVEAQNFEWYLISRTMIKVNELLKEKNYKSKILGNVHDSLVLKLYYNEAYEVIKLAKEVFCENISENNDIPHFLEATLGIWGYGKVFELEELKDDNKVKKEVIEYVNKIREKTIYKEVI